MDRRFTIVCLALLLSATLGITAHAQTAGTVELGLDAGFQYQKFNSGISAISIPVQSFRVGYFITEAIELEPILALSYLKPEGEDGYTTLAFGIMLGYNLPVSSEGGPLFFVQGGGGLDYINYNDSDTQFLIGGAIGVKAPVAERLLTRFEIGGNYYFESDKRVDGWGINVGLGFSFFTK